MLNFFVITLPDSKPSLAQINFVNSGCDDPPNTLILGILEHNDGRCSDNNFAICLYDVSLESELVLIFVYDSSSGIIPSTII